METIAVIHNPFARINIRKKDLGKKLASMLGEGDLFFETRHVDELEQVAETCRQNKVDAIGINGGDGTIHAVVTAFIRVYGNDGIPGLLLMRGGTMNTVARALGISGRPHRILERWLAARSCGKVERKARRVLRVNGQYGFICGFGVVSRFLDAYYKGRGRGVTKALSLVARIISGIMLRSDEVLNMFASEPLALAYDGRDPGKQSYMAVLASTVREVGLGCALTYRCDEDPDGFHLIVTNVPTPALLRNISRLWLGQPWQHPGLHHHGPARHVLIEPPGALRWTLDGDMYESEGPLEITVGPFVDIISV